MAHDVGVGIIGAGYMGRTHAQHYSQLKGARVVAVCDVDQVAAQELAAEVGAELVTTNFRELVTSPTLDVVSICTPDALHRGPAVAAAEAGKHILLEKPLATTREDAEAIINAAEQHHVVLALGFVSRFLKTYEAAHASVADGSIGRLMTISAKRLTGAGVRYAKRDDVVDFLAVHDIDLLRWFGGEIRSVTALADTFVLREYEHRHTAMLLLRFASGAIGYIHSCWVLPASAPYRATSTLEVVGSDGIVSVDTFGASVRIAAAPGISYPLNWDLGDAFRRQLGAFIECAASGAVPVASGKDGLMALDVVLAARRAIQTQTTVEVGGG